MTMAFCVTSYNVLADAYIRPSWYPHTPAPLLVPAQRTPKLVQCIANLSFDIICLQEVSPELYEMLCETLDHKAYVSNFALKGSGKPDGCATFVNTATMLFQSSHVIRYTDGQNGQPDSGHLALIMVLEQDGRSVGVANTHLKWDSPDTKPEDQWAYRQITQLLDERNAIAPDCGAWIICGDLNVTPESEVIGAIRNRGLRDAFSEESPPNTCVANGRAKKIDYLFHSSVLSARTFALPPLDDKTPLPSAQEPSDHLAITATFAWNPL